jgi:hypothetical protein
MSDRHAGVPPPSGRRLVGIAAGVVQHLFERVHVGSVVAGLVEGKRDAVDLLLLGGDLAFELQGLGGGACVCMLWSWSNGDTVDGGGWDR